MRLKTVYNKLDEIPENYRELYSERDAQFVLTGIDGVKTEEDVRRIGDSLSAARTERDTLKRTLKDWQDLGELSEVQSKLSSIPELQARADSNGKLTDEDLEKIVDARVQQKVAPVENQLRKAEEEKNELKNQNTTLVKDRDSRTIRDAIREAAMNDKLGKFRPTAFEDAFNMAEKCFEIVEGKVVVKTGTSFIPGSGPEDWLREIQPLRGHWWEDSEGGGARGGSGATTYPNNPWSADNWNLTQQGLLVSTDRAKAAKMAEAAGSSIGSPAPPAKTS